MGASGQRASVGEMSMDPMAAAWQAVQVILFGVGVGLLCGLPFLLLACAAGMWEKRLVWPYEPCEEHEAPPPTDYSRLMDRMAEEQGFRYLACTRHGGGKLYKIRYDLWLSPDREVFAVVGSGTMAGIVYQVTWLFSKLVDGRVLITVDHTAGVSHDPTGQWYYSLILHADFPELLARHRARLAAEMTPAEPYSEDDPLADHLALRAAQADQVVAMGRATYLDEARMVWRLTPKGAVLHALQTYGGQWARVLPNLGRRQLDRPGQLGYVASDRGPARKVLRYAEIACWVTLMVAAIFMATQPARTREQLLFRLAVGAAAFVGVIAIRLVRLWLSWRQGKASGLGSSGRLKQIALYGLAIAIGLGVALWQAEQKRARRAAAIARIMANMPKQVEADVSLAELERNTKGVARFQYVGSDPEKHHFLDDSQPKVLRIFRIDRKEWQPSKILDVEDDLSTPVAFRDGKLTCLEPEKMEGVDPDPGTREPE
jgi:hypothetical protein